jgi:hypothetical protein
VAESRERERQRSASVPAFRRTIPAFSASANVDQGRVATGLLARDGAPTARRQRPAAPARPLRTRPGLDTTIVRRSRGASMRARS